ncbi:uncharacterized protein LOC142533433 [Primulina tabacum]|uniref:uncharacterized protein LOC142533433 n=1 Tax=Primulina tabacum TaxID=48773 RepID=UPI003F5AA42F
MHFHLHFLFIYYVSLPLFITNSNMKIAFFLLVSATISLAIRPAAKTGGDNDDNGMGGIFGPGGGFNIPGFPPGFAGGGYGGGFGGPKGGYAKGGVIRPTVVCKDKGPCYKKKLTCPTKCFTSYSHAGKGYGGGGGGGGCTIDCKHNCVAYC